MLDTVTDLTIAAAGDTALRDRYLLRGHALLAAVLPEARYRTVVKARDDLAGLMTQVSAAVGRGDWERVREASAEAANLRTLVQHEGAALDAAATVYDAPPVALEPFSPGLESLAGEPGTTVPTHAELLAALERLGQRDAPWAAFYGARRAAMTALRPAARGTAAEPAADTAFDLERQALEAAQRGDVERLRQLADDALRRRGAPVSTGDQPAGTAAGRLVVPTGLEEPFPASAIERGGSLGLGPVEAQQRSLQLGTALAEFLARNAGRASVKAPPVERDGITSLRVALDDSPLAADAKDVMAETLSLFGIHLFATSAGVRYLPVITPVETALVETFPDGDDAASPLLEALALPRRRAVARVQIEDALLRQGTAVVEERLGLDPTVFRLVCIPADLFMRLCGERGWGQREEWTHFDGYRVLGKARRLALVGGNARYGGLADLCGISPTDERANVVARFAVVRRARLTVRLA